MQRPAPSADEVRAALDRVLGAESFRSARRSADLLRYVVNAALKTPGQPVKEYELGAEALGRGEKFDPRFDPIARVEASRVRSRLELHYAGEGAADPIRIEIPKGGYTPAFSHRPEAPAASTVSASPGRREIALWAALGAAIVALVVAGAMLLSPAKPAAVASSGVKTFDAALGAPGVLSDQVGNSLVLSPDGKTLLMQVLLDDGSTRLFARRLDDPNTPSAAELPGTAGTFQPFFSPDGRWVAFFSGGELRKTLIDGGGSPVVLGDAGDMQGLTWSADGYIYGCVPKDNRMKLRRIPETGGDWALVRIEMGETERCAWPHALPDGKGVLYTVFDNPRGPLRTEVVGPAGGRPTIVARGGGASARYSPSGHVLYVDRGTLFAVEFDIDSFRVNGAPRPVLRDVSYREPFWYAHYDIARDGTLVYLRSALSRIEWLDGGDRSRPLLEEPARYFYPRLSPDGRHLAYSIADGPVYRLYLLDLETGRRQRMGNETSNEGGPLWTPDGLNILVTMYGSTAIGWRKPGSTDAAQPLVPGRTVPWSFSPDGRRLAYYAMDEKNHFDLWTVPIESGPDGVTAGKPELFLQTPAVETYPAISPDGKWMAYNSNQSGDFEVYVRPFPGNGDAVKVSTAGGRMAIWSRTANEIFYATNDHRVMVAPYSIRNGRFVTGTPRLFSSRQLSSVGVLANYDLAADGKTVVALVPAVSTGQRDRDHVTVVTNFAEVLRSPPPD